MSSVQPQSYYYRCLKSGSLARLGVLMVSWKHWSVLPWTDQTLGESGGEAGAEVRVSVCRTRGYWSMGSTYFWVAGDGTDWEEGPKLRNCYHIGFPS